MKYFYCFILVFTSLFINAQNNCDDANSYLVSAYSHVKDAYEANNISHLKYYANRSLESFKLSKKSLTTCDCEIALNLANKSIDLLSKVEYAETYEDGRFYVKRARDISKESVIEVDKCSVATNYEDASEITELSDLQNEQLKLKQQQEALKLKEAQIKAQLAEQKEKQLTLQKKQLISSYKSAIAANIKTYNESLKICDCNHNLIKDSNTSTDLSSKSIEEIKTHYINTMKTMATVYLDTLDSCSTN